MADEMNGYVGFPHRSGIIFLCTGSQCAGKYQTKPVVWMGKGLCLRLALLLSFSLFLQQRDGIKLGKVHHVNPLNIKRPGVGKPPTEPAWTAHHKPVLTVGGGGLLESLRPSAHLSPSIHPSDHPSRERVLPAPCWHPHFTPTLAGDHLPHRHHFQV